MDKIDDKPLLLCKPCTVNAHIWKEEFYNVTIGYSTSRYFVKCIICQNSCGYESSLLNAINNWNNKNE